MFPNEIMVRNLYLYQISSLQLQNWGHTTKGPGKGKVEQKIVDFDNINDSKAAFADCDMAFCCLGTTRAKAGAEGFVNVDFDYVVNSAKLLKENGKCTDFHLVSSWGKFWYTGYLIAKSNK